MKLSKDRFSCWEQVGDEDYEKDFDDELIISIKPEERSRDIADYILGMQRKIKTIEKYVNDDREWRTGTKQVDTQLKCNQYAIKLRLNGEILGEE